MKDAPAIDAHAPPKKTPTSRIVKRTGTLSGLSEEEREARIRAAFEQQWFESEEVGAVFV